MAVPTFEAAGAGFATVTSGAALLIPLPSGIAAGDLLIAHVSVRDGATAPATPGGWTLQYGPDPGIVGRHWTYFRVADGLESGDVNFGSPAVTVTRMGRIYRFRGTLAAAMFEGAGSTSGGSSSVLDAGVTTGGAERLAVQLVYVAADRTGIGNFTGETGGDWAEAIAEYVTTLGGDGTLQLQTAPMPVAGTIDGGTIAITSANWGVRGFALIRPATVPLALGGSSTPSGALAKEAQVKLAGAAAPSGSLQRLAGKLLGGSSTPEGGLVKQAQLYFVGETTPTGTLSALFQRILMLAGSISPSGALAHRVDKNLDGTIAPAGTLETLFIRILMLGGSISPSGSLTRQVDKLFAGSVSPSGTRAQRVERFLDGVIAVQGALAKVVGKGLEGSVSPLGELVQTVWKRLLGVIAPTGDIEVPDVPGDVILRDVAQARVHLADAPLAAVWLEDHAETELEL